MLAFFEAHAQVIAAAGLRYPPHEVNFEQSIVAPATIILLEVYLVTRSQVYLDAAREQLRCLESFNGRQPDYHLHEIGTAIGTVIGSACANFGATLSRITGVF